MKIAVEGCAHGELENIYNTIAGIETEQNIKVDLLLCCGDFQSTRNLADLQTMSVPKKYQDMGTFYKYYSGELTAPILTIFIGGNHEASNYLQELPYGGWVAPNIYYIGYAGVVRVNGIRIAGLSGIYKGHDFLRGRHEFAPYTEATIRSVYHVRQLEVFRLKQLSNVVDIFLSHDWPRGIYNYGNKEQLLRFKPHFREEVYENRLGSRPCEDILEVIKPSYWFAAHLHCQFAAMVPHEPNPDDDAIDDEISLSNRFTKFLALDKCLPRRRFLQILDIEAAESHKTHDDNAIASKLLFEYDLEWLTILHLTNHLVNVKTSNHYMPGRGGNSDERHDFTPTAEELESVCLKFDRNLRIPENFCSTVAAYDPNLDDISAYLPQPKAHINPQSTQFCDLLSLDDPLALAMLINGHELTNHSVTLNSSCASFNESVGSISSDLSLSAMRFDISTSSESSPIQQKGNLSLNLPKPTTIDEENLPSLVTPIKRQTTTNPDELVLSEDEENSEDKATSSKHINVAVTLDKQDDKETSEAEILSASLEHATKSPVKKFKRRNQDIYAENTEDD